MGRYLNYRVIHNVDFTFTLPVNHVWRDKVKPWVRPWSLDVRPWCLGPPGVWVPVVALDRPSFWDFASSPDGKLVRTLVYFNETRTQRRVQEARLTLWEPALLRQPHSFPPSGRPHAFKDSASYSWGHKYSK